MESQPLSSISLFFFLTLTFFPSPNNASFSRSISREEVGLKAQDSQTHLTFYFHDVVSGPNPTSTQIAKAPSTAQSSTSFGALWMFDDPLTDGPENKSKLVGRAQGMYGSADQSVSALTMVMNFVFLEGDYNGSTLGVLGRNQVLEGVREMPVVGGTGAFRFAKGYAQAKTHTMDQKTGDAVVQYDVYVSHTSTSDSSDSDSPGSPGSSRSPGSTSNNRAPALSGASLFTMASLLLISLLY